jgi:hypothetical protein
MLPENLTETTPAHIQGLIDSEVAESLTLEYKEALPGASSDEKREFLYDIAAFANQIGGDIIYGLADRRGEDGQATGIADHIAGIKVVNPQTEMARLSNLIRDGISPKLNGIVIHSIASSEGDVLLIRIPRSWNKPHMVIAGHTNKFYRRNNNGKELMSVEEIGRAFSAQRELGEAIQAWRAHRTQLIAQNNGPLRLPGRTAMVFHVIPPSAFNQEPIRDTWTVSEEEKRIIYVPRGSLYYHYNADGFIASGQTGGAARGYAQLFRSGIHEYVDAQICRPVASGYEMILGQEIEKGMVHCFETASHRLRSHENSTAYIGFSLTGISDRAFFTSMRMWTDEQPRIVQDFFISPLVFIDANAMGESPYPSVLLPLVNTMWQIAGRASTPFAPDNVWQPFGDYR